MKKLLLLLLTAAFLTACNLPFIGGAITPTATKDAEQLPTTPPAEIATTTAPTELPLEGTEINLGGVYMVIPPCLPVTASGVIAAQQLSEGPGSNWPQHRLITYSGYPLSGKFFEPMMRVFPVAEYAAQWPFATDQVTALQNLLISRPAQVAESLPLLPNMGAAQVFHLKVKYIDFANGAGVRFLTEYAQYYAPVSNYDLFYTFQGLTSDGKYWISVIFPINHPILPPSPDSTEVPPGGIAIPQMTSPTWETDMQTYYANMKPLMEAQFDASFTPAIDCLDQYLMSLNIGD